MIKLVATDMDGTFLDGRGNFDVSRLGSVLDKFDKAGIVFAVASGRSLLALEKMFQDFSERLVFIAENGNVVKVGNDVVFEASFTAPQYTEIAQILLESPYMNGYDFLLSGENGAYIHEKADSSYVEFISQYYENVQSVPDFSGLTDKIFKVTANFTEDTVHQGESWVNQALPYVQAVTTGFKSIDIILRGVNKRTGLEQLCLQYNLDQTEVLAFGDNLNDYEMLDFAGVAIVPENARDEIKAISDKVIGSHEEEAVIAYMEGLVD